MNIVKRAMNKILYRLFGIVKYSDKPPWKPSGIAKTVTPAEYGDFNILNKAILDHKIEQNQLPAEILGKIK